MRRSRPLISIRWPPRAAVSTNLIKGRGAARNHRVYLSETGPCGCAIQPPRLSRAGGRSPTGLPRRTPLRDVNRAGAFGGVMAGVAQGPPPPVGSGPTSRRVRPARRRRQRAGAAPVASVLRVLLGGGAGSAEARIRIADGAGGSAEIRLASVAGGREVAVQVLTAAAGSRDTLTGVMNEVRLRLRRRGIALTDAGARDPLGTRSRRGTRAVNATTLDLNGCPTRRACGRGRDAPSDGRLLASLPDGWEVELPPLGAVNLATVGVGDVPADALALGIRREGATARLCVATALATRWVDRAIGGGELFAPVRALGPAERGVLLALLAPLLDPIGWSFVLGPGAGRCWPGCHLAGRGRRGRRHDVAASAPPGDRARASTDRARHVCPIEVGVWLASTTLARGALVDVVAGDVVVFDGVASARGGRTRRGRSSWRWAASARLRPG